LRVPQPDARRIADLVAGARNAGLVVELEEKGQLSADPSAATFAAYRIVQEALTNVVRHAPGAAVTVRVHHQPDGIGLRVRNGFATARPSVRSAGAGHGLLGMQERAALCGGWVEAGTRGEGYQVEAWLPQSGGH
jgi:signal transduction histidine kinase